MDERPKSKVVYQFVFIVVAGAIGYGFFNKIFNILLPGAEFITFRPQLIIPVGAGLLLGPFTGGFIGLFGNFFGDLLSGYGLQFWHWSLGNFIIGFVPGIVRWFRVKEIKRVNEFVMVLFFIFLGNFLGLLFGFLLQIVQQGGHNFVTVLNSFYLPAVISNVYILFLLMPPLLIGFRFLKLNIETRSMFFVLFFSLIMVTILSVVLVGIQYKALSGQPESYLILSQMIVKDFRWIGLLLIVIVFVGGIIGYHFSIRYMHPINLLALTADRIKNGAWEQSNTIDPKTAGVDMKNLIDLFNGMAIEIQQREAHMNKVISKLKLEIDKNQEDQLFSEITETDFFRNLEYKSQEIRKRRIDKNET